MKAFVLKEPGVVGWYDAPTPHITDYGAILKPVAMTPCSSDVNTVYKGSKKQPNLILGHECVAKIIEVGKMVKDFSVGEIVAVPAITPDWRALGIQDCNFGHAAAPFSGHQLGRTFPGVFAELFSIPDADTTLAKIPNGVTLRQALMSVDVMTTGFTAVENADIKFGDTVVVIGTGAIGLMAIAGAKLLGAAEIIAVGSKKKNCELAYEYGADIVLDYHVCDIVHEIMKRTSGVGADSVVICGGNDNTFRQAFDIVKYGIGVVSNVNYFGGSGDLPFPKFSGGRGMAGKTLHTSLAKGGRVRIERLLKLIEHGRVDPGVLVTHELYGLAAIEDAFYMMRDKPEGLIKVMVTTE